MKKNFVILYITLYGLILFIATVIEFEGNQLVKFTDDNSFAISIEDFLPSFKSNLINT